MEKNIVKDKSSVLIVCQHYWPESFRINDISHFLIEKDCNVDVLCGLPNYPKGKLFKGYSFFRNRKQIDEGVSIYRAYEIVRGNNSNVRIFLNYISFPFFSLFHIPRMLAKKYDKILLYQLSPVFMTISGIIIGKLKRVETTMYVLDLWPENLFSVLDIKNPYLRKLVTLTSHWHYRQVDKIVVLSQKMKDRIVEITNIPENKVIIIPQAAEKIYETEIRDEKLASRFKKKFNILYAGNISPAQSFETIITTATNIRDMGIKDINWIIVGDGMSRKWLEKEVKKAELQDYFVFEGQKPIEDIPRYTAFCDVLVGCLVKSDLLEATIPAKVMSYLASGRPVALAMDGEVQALINDTIKCGYVTPAGDPNGLTQSVADLYYMQPNERNKMGALGRAYHFKHFERNILLNKLYAFVFN